MFQSVSDSLFRPFFNPDDRKWGRRDSSSSDSSPEVSPRSSPTSSSEHKGIGLHEMSAYDDFSTKNNLASRTADMIRSTAKKRFWQRGENPQIAKDLQLNKLEKMKTQLQDEVKKPSRLGKSLSRQGRCLIKIEEVAHKMATLSEEDNEMPRSDSKTIGTGKAKEVKEGNDPDEVFITPLHSSKEREIKGEVDTCQAIRHVLKEKRLETDHSNLALQLDVLTGDEQIQGKYTVKAPRARKDLETEMNSPQLPFSESFKFIYHIANGMSYLHQAGYVHGDLKPDNVFLYKTHGFWNAKIGDFGKTKALEEGKIAVYSGNPRFSSFDQGLTFEGEVFSTALLMIRTLESRFLDESPLEMLIEPSSKREVNEVKRKGIEKFVILSETCPQQELSNVSEQMRFYINKQIPSAPHPEATEDIHRYIDALIDKLKKCEEPGMPSQWEIELLGSLLKRMTDSVPANRPTMKAVAEQLWLPDAEESHLDVQKILIDPNLKQPDETKMEWRGEERFIPHQFMIDFPRSRYFLNQEDLNRPLASDAEKMTVSDLPIAPTLGAAISLADEFGYQGFANIASLCQQGSAVLLTHNANQFKKNHTFGSIREKPVEYHIEDLGEKVKITLFLHLKSRYENDDGLLEEDQPPYYLAIKRIVTLSKEDLNTNWDENQTGLIAPSLEVKDLYSHLQTTLETAIEELAEK
ncbi:MAG: protein kinase [Parachlamydiaceae bacterium]